MWIFFNDSFVSCVEHKKDHTKIMVRARLQGGIEALFPGVDVERTPDADYLYRAVVSKEDVSKMVSDRIQGIDYPNFKNSVTDNRRHDAYSRVWEVMLQAQEMYNKLVRKY